MRELVKSKALSTLVSRQARENSAAGYVVEGPKYNNTEKETGWKHVSPCSAEKSKASACRNVWRQSVKVSRRKPNPFLLSFT